MFKVDTGQYELRLLPSGRFDSIFDGGLIAVANWYERDCISYIHGGVQIRVHCKDTVGNRMADSAFTFILIEKP
jgi:hypothetical protein